MKAWSLGPPRGHPVAAWWKRVTGPASGTARPWVTHTLAEDRAAGGRKQTSVLSASEVSSFDLTVMQRVRGNGCTCDMKVKERLSTGLRDGNEEGDLHSDTSQLTADALCCPNATPTSMSPRSHSAREKVTCLSKCLAALGYWSLSSDSFTFWKDHRASHRAASATTAFGISAWALLHMGISAPLYLNLKERRRTLF